MKGRKYNFLITGGCGFIGSNIAHHLIRLGHNVRIIDNLTTGRLQNIKSILEAIDFIEGDIRDMSVIRKSVSDVDFVFHTAALASVPESIKNPMKCLDINEKGTLNLLEGCSLEDIKRIIFSSSAAVYGDLPDLPKTEESDLKPLSPYAVSKIAGEYYCKCYYHNFGLESVILRYFNVFGPRQLPNSDYAAVIPKFIDRVKQKKPLTVHGDGKQTRDFIFIEDIVKANMTACFSEGIAGQIFNIASGESIELLKLIDYIREPDTRIFFEKPREGDIKYSSADITKAKKHLGFEPNISLDRAISITKDYFYNS
ncbi:MAG: NAD-dependent epimerase/dehydratase family protein [Candidatus Zixiibacteriota bacterium]